MCHYGGVRYYPATFSHRWERPDTACVLMLPFGHDFRKFLLCSFDPGPQPVYVAGETFNQLNYLGWPWHVMTPGKLKRGKFFQKLRQAHHPAPLVCAEHQQVLVAGYEIRGASAGGDGEEYVVMGVATDP